MVGAVERGGRVVARVAEKVNGKALLKFMRNHVDAKGTVVVTDEFRGYNAIKADYYHAVINHQKAYAVGGTHTNTIEGFWSLLKRAFHGSHHHYTKQFMPLYVAESCWKYNNRKNENAFGDFLRFCVS